jgi:hypothetical protein
MDDNYIFHVRIHITIMQILWIPNSERCFIFFFTTLFYDVPEFLVLFSFTLLFVLPEICLKHVYLFFGFVRVVQPLKYKSRLKIKCVTKLLHYSTHVLLGVAAPLTRTTTRVSLRKNSVPLCSVTRSIFRCPQSVLYHTQSAFKLGLFRGFIPFLNRWISAL